MVFVLIVIVLLYLMIFGYVLLGCVEVYLGVEYVSFFVLGFVMMSVL